MRTLFLIKVYLLLACSLAVSALGAGAAVLKGLSSNSFWPLFGLELVTLCLAYSLRKRPRINVVAYFIFSFTTGLCLGPIVSLLAAAGRLDILYIALGLTLAMFLALTAYAATNPKQYSAKRSLSQVGGAMLIVVGMAIFQSPSNLALYLFIWAVLLLFAFYIVRDSRRIMTSFNDNEAVTAAIDMHLNLHGLLQSILSFLTSVLGIDPK